LTNVTLLSDKFGITPSVGFQSLEEKLTGIKKRVSTLGSIRAFIKPIELFGFAWW
jgi:hypothetical protein